MAVVEHGTVKHLEGDGHLASFPRQQRQRGSQTAARTDARNADLLRVDAEFIGLLMGPLQAPVTVLKRAGVRVSGARRYSTEIPTTPSFGHHWSNVGSSIE